MLLKTILGILASALTLALPGSAAQADTAGIATAGLLNWYSGGAIKWQTGLDSSNSNNEDLVLAGRYDNGNTWDSIYLRFFPGEGTAIGLNATPPPKARVSIGNVEGGAWPNLDLFAGQDQSGEMIQFRNSAGARMGGVDALGKLDTPGLRISSSVVPASSTSPCRTGQIEWGQDFIYVCVAPDTWRRSRLESW